MCFVGREFEKCFSTVFLSHLSFKRASIERRSMMFNFAEHALTFCIIWSHFLKKAVPIALSAVSAALNAALSAAMGAVIARGQRPQTLEQEMLRRLTCGAQAQPC